MHSVETILDVGQSVTYGIALPAYLRMRSAELILDVGHFFTYGIVLPACLRMRSAELILDVGQFVAHGIALSACLRMHSTESILHTYPYIFHVIACEGGLMDSRHGARDKRTGPLSLHLWLSGSCIHCQLSFFFYRLQLFILS